MRLLPLFRMGFQLLQHLPLPLLSWSALLLLSGSALPPLPESALPLLVLWWSFGRLGWSLVVRRPRWRGPGWRLRWLSSLWCRCLPWLPLSRQRRCWWIGWERRRLLQGGAPEWCVPPVQV